MNHISPHELIEFRNRFKLSQGRLALRTGISSFEIGEFERGKRILSSEQHRALMLFVADRLMGAMR